MVSRTNHACRKPRCRRGNSVVPFALRWRVLRVEALEDRRLLAVFDVNSVLDTVDAALMYAHTVTHYWNLHGKSNEKSAETMSVQELFESTSRNKPGYGGLRVAIA